MNISKLIVRPTYKSDLLTKIESGMCSLVKVTNKNRVEIELLVDEKCFEFKVISLESKINLIKNLLQKALTGEIIE